MIDYIKVLEKISNQFGITGYESRVANTILNEIEKDIDGYKISNLGNLIAFKKGTIESHPKLMLSTHIDEVGFVVSAVLENGFLRVTPRGGIDYKILQSKEVVLHTDTGQIPAIFCSIPPHLLTEEERNTTPNFDYLILDTGLNDKETKEKIKIGTPVIYKSNFTRLRNERVSGKTFDNRVSALVNIALLNELKNIINKWDIYTVFSTQEEVGSQGSETATYEINPDIGIALDVTFGDQPDISEVEYKLGDGIGIGIGPNFTPKIVKDMETTAKEEKIKYFLEPMSRPAGTDAAVMQVTRMGFPTALISVPVRYMHSPIETVEIGDIKSAVKLLLSYIIKLDDKYLEDLKWS
jgi:endoglucanase